VAIEKQPSYIKYGRLRDFQLTGLNFLAYNWVKSRNVILADEMGLGKTVQTVAFMNWLRHDREQQGPFLVVVPLSTIPAWAETIDNWTPDINYVVYNGKEAARDVIKEYELLVDGNSKRPKFHILLTTYEYILQDAGFLSQIKWQFMAVDEAHRLKNRDSQLYSKLLEFKAPSRLLITGTPVQNSLGELSALMDFLMPGVVKIEEDMVLQPDDKDTQKKLSELHKVIEPYILRRTKKKVENDLPPKIEKIMRMGLSDIQLEYYKNILTRNYSALNQGSKGHKQSLLNIMMELKKISNHPFMFPSAEERLLTGRTSRQEVLRITIESSGKMILLNKLLDRLKEEGHRVLIFSQMVKMLDILGDYLRLRGFQFQRLDGTISASSRRLAIDHFNAPDSNDFVFLLSTRAGGLGINLMTADTVILFDSDWNPQADLQAMARAHRIGQTRPVTIYRFLARETVEEEVLERARNKRFLEYLTIQRGVTDKDKKELTQKGIKNGKIAEPTRADDLSRILKRRGQKMFEQQGNQKKLEEVDLDDILAEGEILNNEGPDGEADGGEEFLKSFEYTDVNIDNITWDMIIPRDELDKIKIEEKKKADEKYLAEVIEQNAPRKRKTASDEREQRAIKKRARDTATSEPQEKAEDKTDLDPKRPLGEKELRNLFRAFQRYGALEDRGEELIQDAGLVGRDHDLLRATLEEVTKMSVGMVERERQRLEDAEKESSKPLTKKDRKAVLFDYKGVKRLNAETILSRPHEMRMIREVIRTVPDAKNFRIPEASKPAHYTCSWGAREDGMLCVGIDKHGYGAWVAIRDDPDLGMGDKFFLEEHRVDKKEERVKGDEKNPKSPGAVHLVRRADYLLSVLREKTSDGTNPVTKKAVQNHHRNNKRSGMQPGKTEKPKSVSNSPAPSGRNIHREKPMYLDRFGQIDHRLSKRGHHENGVKSDIKRKSSDGDDDRDRKRSRTFDDRLGPERKQNHGGQTRSDTGRKVNGSSDGHDRSKTRRNDDKHGRDDDANGVDTKRKRRDGECDGDKSERKHRKSDETVTHRENRHIENGFTKLDTKQKRGDGASKSEERRENLHEGDEILYKLFKPVRPSLKRVQRATQEIHRGSKQERAQILKRELLAIGDHVKTLWDERNKTVEVVNLGKRLW
jgi:chromodomain-helicase-DNA-binding protein 1